MSKKQNPRSRPRNQQDVDRAKQAGIEEGANLALGIMLITLKDLGEPDIFISKFEQKFRKTLASIMDGDIKGNDIMKALGHEYEIEVQYTDA